MYALAATTALSTLCQGNLKLPQRKRRGKKGDTPDYGISIDDEIEDAKDAKMKRNQLKGYKSNVTKEYKSGTISEEERQIKNKRIDNARSILNEYIKHYESKVKTMKGSGIRGKRRGGSIMFYNNVKQLLKKLELIVSEIMAGNTSVEMRNTGVA